MKTLVMRQGEKLTIRAIAFERAGAQRDQCPMLAFFEEQSKRDPLEFSKLTALLDFVVKNGPPKNETKFKHLTGTNGLYEFKTNGGLRLCCFWDATSLIICTHGFLKKKQQTPAQEIKKAAQLKTEYFKAKASGDLTHVEAKK